MHQWRWCFLSQGCFLFWLNQFSVLAVFCGCPTFFQDMFTAGVNCPSWAGPSQKIEATMQVIRLMENHRDFSQHFDTQLRNMTRTTMASWISGNFERCYEHRGWPKNWVFLESDLMKQRVCVLDRRDGGKPRCWGDQRPLVICCI